MNLNPTVILAPNAFKESLSAAEAAAQMARGVMSVLPAARCVCIPVADGGDGTLAALTAAGGGKLLRRRVCGPLGEKIPARFAWLPESRSAIVELAEAAGLRLLDPAQRNPLRTTTYGVGELIRAALKLGARRIIIGLGGSATVDCGAGLAQALGARLLDRRGRELAPGGAELLRLRAIDLTETKRILRGVRIEAACDVKHPLLGPGGGIQVFAPQKGATAAQCKLLERAAANFAAVAAHDLKRSIANIPGAGAAGGTGAGLLGFCNAQLRPGSELILDALDFPRRIRGAALIFTGEGRIDESTRAGKAPAAVAAAAKKLGIPCIAFCGSLGPGAEKLHGIGFTAIFSICREPLSLAVALKNAPQLLRQCAEQAARAWLAGKLDQ